MAVCPDDHVSESTDFCDVCGLQIRETATPPPMTTTPALLGEPCPRCGEPRTTGRFCEECSFDFVAGVPPIPEPVELAEPVLAAPVVAATVLAKDSGLSWWTATVAADRAYYEIVRADSDPDEPEVPFPAFLPERVFALRGEQLSIGRHSRSRGLNPEIDLTGPPLDPGISHLHALLVARPDGWAVVDTGSTNGTTVNDDPDPIAVDTPIPLAHGDRIHLGAWTTITVSAPANPKPGTK